jgi:hypothetical protein
MGLWIVRIEPEPFQSAAARNVAEVQGFSPPVSYTPKLSQRRNTVRLGVILIKLQKQDDRLLGFIASTGDRDLMTVETSRGAEQTLSTAKYEVTGRGGKGRELLQRGQFTRVLWPTPEAPAPLTS